MAHKINHGWSPNRNDPEWEARVEAEAKVTTNATEKRHADREARLARAEQRLAKARERQAEAIANKAQARRVQRLNEVVAKRIEELQAIHREMTSTPAGSTHRGTGSYRGVGTSSDAPIRSVP